MQFHHLQSFKLAKCRTLSFNKFCFVQFSFKIIWRESGLEMVSGLAAGGKPTICCWGTMSDQEVKTGTMWGTL